MPVSYKKRESVFTSHRWSGGRGKDRVILEVFKEREVTGWWSRPVVSK